MSENFSKRNGFVVRSENERLIFYAASGFILGLFVILLVIIGHNSDTADAGVNLQTAKTEVVGSPGTITLYAPERPVRAGTKFSDINLRELYWPRNQVPEGAVLNSNEVKDMYAKSDLDPAVPLTYTVLTKEPREGMPLPVTAGMRAVSIEVDQTSGLEGHALPGTFVDVTLTFMENSQLITKVIVQNAKVLSFGGDVTTYSERSGNSKSPAAGKTMTLEVNPGDALKIQTSRQLGRLGLILRAAGDDKTINETEMPETSISDDVKRGSRLISPKQRECGGTVRISGKEYIMGCDGSLNEVVNEAEP